MTIASKYRDGINAEVGDRVRVTAQGEPVLPGTTGTVTRSGASEITPGFVMIHPDHAPVAQSVLVRRLSLVIINEPSGH